MKPLQDEDQAEGVCNCKQCHTNLKLVMGKVDWKYICPRCQGAYCKKCFHRGRPMYLKEADPYPTMICDPCYLQVTPVDLQKNLDIYGPEDGRPLIMLHGAVMGRQAMEPIVLPFVEAGFRVYVPDLPRHNGLKDTPLNDDAVDAQVMKIFQDELDRRPALIVGGSFGGWVAMRFSQRHPELCSGLILNGCLMFQPDDKKRMVRFVMKGVHLVPPERRVRMAIDSLQRDFGLDPAVVRKLSEGGYFYECWTEMWEWLGPLNLVNAVAEFPRPILFLLSDKDTNNRAEQSYTAVAKQGTRVMLHGHHPLMLQHPKQSSKECLAWIDDHYLPGNNEWLLREKPLEHKHDVRVTIPSCAMEIITPEPKKQWLSSFRKTPAAVPTERVGLYTLQANIDGTSYECTKRFQDFVQFRDGVAALAQNHPHKALLPSLPKKKLKAMTDHEKDEFLESRRKQIGEFFEGMINRMDYRLWLLDLINFVAGKESLHRQGSVVIESKSPVMGHNAALQTGFGQDEEGEVHFHTEGVKPMDDSNSSSSVSGASDDTRAVRTFTL